MQDMEPEYREWLIDFGDSGYVALHRLAAAAGVGFFSKGSHHVFVHPTKPGHISVPHPKKDLGVGLLHKLLKQAGLR